MQELTAWKFHRGSPSQLLRYNKQSDPNIEPLGLKRRNAGDFHSGETGDGECKATHQPEKRHGT
jgi:hypothetical protein